MANQDKNGNVSDIHKKRPLRLWPGVLTVALQWLGGFILPAVFPRPEVMIVGVMGSLALGIVLVAWWLFFSRAARLERWGGILLIIAAMFIVSLFLDKSIATGNMGLMFILYAVPVMSLAFVAWAVAASRLSGSMRNVTMVLTILAASGIWLFLRSDGISGAGRPDFTWRWALTHEERLLSESSVGSSVAVSAANLGTTGPEWPGFRGAGRNAVVRGVKIATDWKKSPPVEMWRRPVGPGCSSVAISGNLMFTQEQRGECEMVSCYELSTGNPVWTHSDTARFYDSHAGAGPRSTPSICGNRIYALGATGILNALDISDGSVFWSRHAASDARAEAMTWGFTASPLVTGNVVIVALSGKLAAYDTATGEPRWFGPYGGASYSSPHLLTVNGAAQVLLMSGSGAVSLDPADGSKLWEYPWAIDARILQPALLDNGDLLLSAENKDLRCVNVSQRDAGYKIRERWTSSEMNVNFNDHVVHKGFAYGFDGPSLACIDLRDGNRMWKGANYRGWILLLADQDLLLILTEKGVLATVPANPEGFRELSRFQAIQGKTWNHPAMAGNVIVVRNSEEMAAFRLQTSFSTMSASLFE